MLTAALDVNKLVLQLFVGVAIIMWKLLCFVYVMFVFLIGYGVARDYSRESNGNVQFTSAKRLRRHDHKHHVPESHHTNNHRETEARRHDQHISGDDFKTYNEHQQNENYLDHSDSRDQYRPATAIARLNNDKKKHEHYSNEFNQQPPPTHISFNKHTLFYENQQENYERHQQGHETDFNHHGLQNLPSSRHYQGRQTGQYESDNQHHDHIGKGSDIIEQPRLLHGQQFEETPVNHHRQAGQPENQRNTQHQNLPSDRYDQNRQTGRYHLDNQYNGHRRKNSVMLEQPRGVHSQQFEDKPVDHNHRTGHPENQHETQHRNQWNDRGSVQQYPYDNNQQFHVTESTHFNNTQRHGVQIEKDISYEEVVTERSSKDQLAQEENLQLSGKSTRDQNNTRSHETKSVSQLETNHQHTTITPTPTTPTTTPTIATTHTSNVTHSHTHFMNVAVLTAPDLACADGMAKDFTNKCRPVYKTDEA